jgi:SAM-dependent methyltransferase
VVPGELTSCPACAAGGIVHLHPLPLHGRFDGYRVGFASGCCRCGVVFANPMPAVDALSHMYSPAGVWGQTHEHDVHEHSPSRYVIRLFDAVRHELDLTRPPTGAAALDFGCGAGELLDSLQDLGWATYGIEPAVKQAFARHHELQAIPPTPMFRLAVAHHVLEHVRDPLATLRALFASIEPGGFLFVSVPRLDTLPHHRDFRYCINDRAHIMSYTRDAMAALMGMAGFQAIDLNPPPGEDTGGRRALKRLRMLGRKGGTPTSIEQPLRAAEQVFEAWVESGERPAMRARGTSVRMAAAIQNIDRARATRPTPDNRARAS